MPADQGKDAPLTWLIPLREKAAAQAKNGLAQIALDVQGLHCAACVWLLEQLFLRETGGLRITVNPGLGQLELCFRLDTFPLESYLREIARFGYRTGPAHKTADGALDDLLIRFGVAAAIAMNSMIFSASMYFGLSADTDATIYRLFAGANLILSVAAVLFGGSVFFRSAALALRRRVLHMDVPIALGILLSFAGSTWAFFARSPDAAYFDTVNIFITLMLLGRLLQRRLVIRSRNLLLQDDGVDGLVLRRLARSDDGDGRLEVVPAAAIRKGDTLVLAPGELLPVEGLLLDARASFALEWITGEPEPREFSQGEALPAGAHNGGGQAVRVRASGDFQTSALRPLLGAPLPADEPQRGFWHYLARTYVQVVLGLAALGLILWWNHGVDRALSVVVSLLVVTCPCALGLATPLCYELTQGRLRRRGVFLRSASFLDRALRVRKVLFDKTGTLTLGELVLDNAQILRELPERQQVDLYHLVARSNHPKSRAIYQALQRVLPRPPAYDASLQITEIAGQGLSLLAPGGPDAELRLGGPTFVMGSRPAAGESAGTEDDVWLGYAGAAEPLLRLRFREELRPDARAEIEALRRGDKDLYILSGDAPHRARELGRRLGLRPDRVLGGLSPEDKARLVREIDQRDTLMIGDGINDAPALTAAYTAGTPAVDRPAVPARADFYFLGRGLLPVSQVLDLCRTARAVIVRNLVLAGIYNVLVVTLSLCGRMTPLRAAVAMPLSSIIILLLTVRSLREPAPAALAPAPRALPRTAEVIEVQP